MNDGVKFRRKLGPKGDSTALVIPQQLLDYLGADEGDVMIISSNKDNEDNKYISLWIDEKNQ